MRHRHLLPLLLLPLLALPVAAQDVLPEIVVQAPGEAASQAFVGDVLDDTHGKQLARWHQPLCVTLRGFTPDQEGRFTKRLQEAASIAALPPAKTGCKPNAIVLLTTAPDLLIDRMLAQHPGIFAPAKPSEVRRKLADGGVARVWSVALTMGADGSTPDAAMKGGATITSVKIAPGNATRLASATRADLFRAMVILDVKGLAGLPLDAVADHVAMRLLGQMGEAEGGRLPSILSLFQTNAGPRPLTLTDWDRALLRELYTAPAGATADRQRRQIARRLADTAGSEP